MVIYVSDWEMVSFSLLENEFFVPGTISGFSTWYTHFSYKITKKDEPLLKVRPSTTLLIHRPLLWW